jgi:hypothetical protein
MHRKLDNWYYTSAEAERQDISIDDSAIACWTRSGKRYSRGTILRLLKAGPKQWNRWRRSLPDIEWYRVSGRMFWLPGFVLRLPNCDLRNHNFTGYELVGADFSNSVFTKSTFDGVDFHQLVGRPFQPRTTLDGCGFRSAKFAVTNFSFTSAAMCDFSHAELNGAKFSHSDVHGSVFFKTIVAASFTETNVADANFDNAYLLTSTFINMDLSKANNFVKAHAYPPINIDARTLLKSGNLPKDFYRACGISGRVENNLRKVFNSKTKRVRVFISYSSKDESFVTRLKYDLEEHGIETWYAPRDLAIGATTREDLDKAILSVDRLIVVLSKTSIISRWVEQELETALERERTSEKFSLLPIKIDQAVMKSRTGWAALLRRTRNIGDFTNRDRDARYFSTLGQLLDDIRRS